MKTNCIIIRLQDAVFQTITAIIFIDYRFNFVYAPKWINIKEVKLVDLPYLSLIDL